MPINPAEISTIRVGELTPELPTIESKIAHEIGTDLFRCTISELIDLLNLNIGTLQYEIKTLHVNQTYIDNNFDETGLGVDLLEGFAICNGNNGTPPLDGLVTVGYGTNYNVIGGFGGEKDHVLTMEELPSEGASGGNYNTGSGTILFNNIGLETGTDKVFSKSLPLGTNEPHNNMQPYMIALKIMKL